MTAFVGPQELPVSCWIGGTLRSRAQDWAYEGDGREPKAAVGTNRTRTAATSQTRNGGLLQKLTFPILSRPRGWLRCHKLEGGEYRLENGLVEVVAERRDEGERARPERDPDMEGAKRCALGHVAISLNAG